MDQKLRGKLQKVVVFGGGSFGTAMGAALAEQRPGVQVVLLLRDPYLCKDINEAHCNTRYLKVPARPRRAQRAQHAGGGRRGVGMGGGRRRGPRLPR